jgi:hypothetical protein
MVPQSERQPETGQEDFQDRAPVSTPEETQPHATSVSIRFAQSVRIRFPNPRPHHRQPRYALKQSSRVMRRSRNTPTMTHDQDDAFPYAVPFAAPAVTEDKPSQGSRPLSPYTSKAGVRPCRVSGCPTRTNNVFSVYCPAHHTRIRRHGDAQQHSVMSKHLAPHKKTVTRIRKRNKHLHWENIHARWELVVKAANNIILDWEAGRPINVHDRAAAYSIQAIASDATPKAVVDTVIAMYLFQATDPHFFKSDTAFNTQLVRMLRKLSPKNAQKWVNALGSKSAFRELVPKARDRMASWVIPTIGPVGLHVVKLEKDRLDDGAQGRAKLHEELKRMRA